MDSPALSDESTRLIHYQYSKPHHHHHFVEHQTFLESIRSVDARTWLFIYANASLIIYTCIGIATLICLGSPWTLVGCSIASFNWGFLIFAAVSKTTWPLKTCKRMAKYHRIILLISLFALTNFTIVLLFIDRTKFDNISFLVSKTVIGVKLGVLQFSFFTLLTTIILTIDIYLRTWLIKESLEAVKIDEARKARLRLLSA